MHLILDLDETLIRVSTTPIKDYDFTFTLQSIKYYGRKRPNLDLFLTFAFRRFQTVSIWTAATAEYARKVLNHIMTAEQRRKIAFLRTRRDLEGAPGSYYKPLKKIFSTPNARKLGMNPRNTIMIDDRDDVLRDNPGNGIKIPPWNGVKGDQYLPKLIIILDGVLHHNLGFGHFPKVLDLKTLVD